MKKFGMRCMRLLALLLVVVMACGAMPLAGAVDGDPPLYEYLEFESPEEFLSVYALDDTSYEWFSSTYATYLEACRQDEQVMTDHWGYSPSTAAEVHRIPLAELPQMTAWRLTYDDYYEILNGYTNVMSPLSVQLNGDTVSFPDAAPESVNGRVMVPMRAMVDALGGQTGFQNDVISVTIGGKSLSLTVGSTSLVMRDSANGEQTISMDTAPYIKEGRTYIPVRFFAQALGYTVQWDEYENTAVLYDRAALILSIDKDFTVVNQWLKAQPKFDPAQKWSAALALAITYTELNSIDGDQSATMSGTLNIVAEGQNYEVSVKFDVYALVKMLLTSLDEEYDMETFAALGLLQNDLKNATFDMIFNADENVLYFRCPLLFKLLGSYDPEMVPSVGADAWLKFKDIVDPDLYSVYTGIPEVAQSAQSLTVGVFVLQQTENTYQTFPSAIFSACQSRVDSLQMLTDGKLAKSGNAYTGQYHFAVTSCGEMTTQPYETTSGGNYRKGTLTLHLDTGAAEGTFETRSQNYYSDTLTTYTFSGNAASAKFSMTIHQKNQSICEMLMDFSLKPSAASPASKPPAADKIVDAEEWANSLYASDEVQADITYN